MAGEFEIKQPRHGYRYSLDPFLLADSVTAVRARRVIDLGTGNGILPLLIGKKFPDATTLLGIDIRREPLLYAVENCARIENRPCFIQSDIRRTAELIKAGSFDLAISNPPYRKAGSGKINSSSDRAVARHEIALTFRELARAACHVLSDGGAFCLVHLAERSAEVIKTLQDNRLSPADIRFVHSKPNSDAFLIIVNSIKNGKNAVKIKPPITVYSRSGEFSAEMKAVYERLTV